MLRSEQRIDSPPSLGARLITGSLLNHRALSVTKAADRSADPGTLYLEITLPSPQKRLSYTPPTT